MDTTNAASVPIGDENKREYCDDAPPIVQGTPRQIEAVVDAARETKMRKLVGATMEEVGCSMVRQHAVQQEFADALFPRNKEDEAPAWVQQLKEAVLELKEDLNERLNGMENTFNAQLQTFATNVSIRLYNSRSISALRPLHREVPSSAPDEEGTEVGALNEAAETTANGGVFPVSNMEISGMTHAQITRLALWYGLSDSIIPAEGPGVNVETRRVAVQVWVGSA